MDPLKKQFQEKATALRDEVKALLKEHREKKVGEVQLGNVFGGMRGVKSMIWETSNLDPIEGIRFRGYSIPELREKLPTAEGDKEPLPEALFWLMLTGDVPTKEQTDWVSQQWRERAAVPAHTFAVLDALPEDTHPMTQFSIAIVSLQSESVFAKRYSEGISKYDYWDPTYEDAMNLIARLPKVAAYIYRRTFHGLTIHADHEGGNASAHATHLVGSTLSDCYFSLAGGMNALAGPLHGLANQEVIKWIFEMIESLGVVWNCFDVIPDILKGLGKVKNPWPNVDAHSGAILVHYGIKEYSYYTVLFGVSRALGVLSALCWSRALGFPLERPKSVTTKWVKEFLKKEEEITMNS